jgi:hypothetical protein
MAVMWGSLVCAVACACTTTTPGVPSPRVTTDSAAAVDQAPPGGCPLSAEDLSSASGLSFELRDTREDHPLETVEAKGQVCVYTSSDRPQAAGDPLVLRVDTVTGAGADVLQSGFAATCVQAGGRLENADVEGARVCDRSDSVTEGEIVGVDRTVDVYFVVVDRETAAVITPKFGQILAAVR